MLIYGCILHFILDAVVEIHKEILLLNSQKFYSTRNQFTPFYSYIEMPKTEWRNSSRGIKYCVITCRYKRLAQGVQPM